MHVLNEWHLQGQCHHDLPLKKMSKNELPLTQGNKGGGGWHGVLGIWSIEFLSLKYMTY